MIRITDPLFDNSSYIDPRGRVFYHEGHIFRAIFPEASSFYRKFLSLNKTLTLMKQGKIIETALALDIEVEGFDLIVRQRKIQSINYCFEWSANMLRDAALLTIGLAIDFCDDNIVLQDASPYNIFFDFSKPVFIDFCSFVPEITGYLWSAYQQFCNFFLFPLYLFSCDNLQLTNQLMKNYSEGISADTIIRIMTILDKMKTPGYFSRVFLPKMLSQASRMPSDQKKARQFLLHLIKNKKTIELQQIRKRFLINIREHILNLRLPSKKKGVWNNYYNQTEQNILQRKCKLVYSVTKNLSPKTVLDIGCNMGEFSILAAETGAKVIAFDTDHYCIDVLYKEAKNQNLSILPLIMDIVNPTPQMGWRGIQFKNAQERFKSDMVYALAIMHHLVFSKGFDFERIIQSFKDFCNKWLIIEYISPDDSMAQLLPRRPSIDYSWYNYQNFLNILSKYFSEIDVLDQIDNTRMLIIAKV